MSDKKEARKLIHTVQGKKWLNQFDPLDQEIASSLANNLTLVSHNEFERNLTSKMAQIVDGLLGPVAFFAIREMIPRKPVLKGGEIKEQVYVATPFYEQVETADDGQSVVPLGNTADVGSEGRVASIIRQFCNKDKNNYLNHPSLQSLRDNKCRSIVLVDDFIGSGNRAFDFIDSFWMEKTIVSWSSYKLIDFHVIAYSGVDNGVTVLESHKSSPSVHVYRDAPTFNALPWSMERKDELMALCEKYGRISNKKKKHMWWGYKKTMCSLVFEHGCPNNVPAILIEDSDKWTGLFPARTISDTTLSVFPGEIPLEAKIESFDDIGHQQLGEATRLISCGKEGKIMLLILALISKGKKKKSTLFYATGLNNDDCDEYLARCIEWRFVSPQKRITPAGLAELKAAKKVKKVKAGRLHKGSNYYYPKQLRRSHGD